MKVYFLKNFNLFPLLPILVTSVGAYLEKVTVPRCGIYTWAEKKYFVVGGFKYFLGLKLKWIS